MHELVHISALTNSIWEIVYVILDYFRISKHMSEPTYLNQLYRFIYLKRRFEDCVTLKISHKLFLKYKKKWKFSI